MGISIEEIEKKYIDKKQDLTTWFNSRPGSFIPYQSSHDFLESLALPLIIPIASSSFCAVTTIITGLSSLLCAASLLSGAFTGLLGIKKAYQPSFDLTVLTALVAGVSLLAATVSALMIVLGTTHAAMRLMTRTGATLFAPLFNFFNATKNTASLENTTNKPILAYP